MLNKTFRSTIVTIILSFIFITNLFSQAKIILDTDMGSDCDDVGAMALLHRYADQGKVEILGCIYSSGKVPYGAGIIEAINILYGRPEIPIGANWNDEVGDPKDKMTAEKLARDTAAFANSIIHNKDAREQTRLNRKILANQIDKSVTYITIGHTKALYDLLVSESDSISRLSGSELIKKKIKRWVALGALGAYNESGTFVKDWNFFFNNTAKYTEYLVDNIPTDVFFINAGSDVMTGKSLISTPSGNIVRTAYRDWLWNVFEKTLADQRPSWDLAAIYYTIEDLGKYLIKAPAGKLEFDAQKGCCWITEEKQNNHHLIIQKDGVNQEFAEYLNKLIGEQ